MNANVPCWDSHSEKLRCHLVLDDGIAKKLSPRAAPAYFRAFIVEDRATHRISIKFRYKYLDPAQRTWYSASTDLPDAEGVELFAAGMKKVLRLAAAALGVTLTDDQFQAYYPPDDGGDPMSTIIWLEMKDLVEVTMVEETGGLPIT